MRPLVGLGTRGPQRPRHRRRYPLVLGESKGASQRCERASEQRSRPQPDEPVRLKEGSEEENRGRAGRGGIYLHWLRISAYTFFLQPPLAHPVSVSVSSLIYIYNNTLQLRRQSGGRRDGRRHAPRLCAPLPASSCLESSCTCLCLHWERCCCNYHQFDS